MHSGIWSLCVDLTEGELKELFRIGMPHASQCINYLAESAEFSRHEDMKFDQHGDLQVTRRPSLSKYQFYPYFITQLPKINQTV